MCSIGGFLNSTAKGPRKLEGTHQSIPGLEFCFVVFEIFRLSSSKNVIRVQRFSWGFGIREEKWGSWGFWILKRSVVRTRPQKTFP
jgi:hypothetical protein